MRNNVTRKTGKYSSLERKNSMKAKGIRVVIEELKQRLKAKSARIRRYQNRINQYRQSRMLRVKQKKVFKELNGEILSERVVPHAEESKKFWEEMWGNDEQYKSEGIHGDGGLAFPDYGNKCRRHLRNSSQNKFIQLLLNTET